MDNIEDETAERMLPRISGAPRLCQDVAEAVGQVPIVRLNGFGEACRRHELYLKLESCNPGGSIKEKNAVHLVREAEAKGRLKPGGTIVESSSGNFGIGLAMLGAARGYRVIIVVDAKTPPPIRRMLGAYGAEMVELPLSAVDRHGSMQVARMEKAREIAERIPGAWYPCQHRNPSNPDAHALYTAREIEAAFDGAPDAIVVGVSTAGQLAGMTRYFKQRSSAVRFVGVDVAGSVIFGTPPRPYKMTGLGLCFIPPSFQDEVLSAAYSIGDKLAFSVCHELARREGLLLGASTGAIVAAGLAFAGRQNNPQRILMVNPDRGDRYLETVYNPEWLSQNNLQLLKGPHLEAAIGRLEPLYER